MQESILTHDQYKDLAHEARYVKAPIERAWNLVPARQIGVVKIHGPHDWPHEPRILVKKLFMRFIPDTELFRLIP